MTAAKSNCQTHQYIRIITFTVFFLSVKHIKKLFVISVDFTESVPHLFLLCCGVLNNTSVKAVSATLQLYVENKGLQG